MPYLFGVDNDETAISFHLSALLNRVFSEINVEHYVTKSSDQSLKDDLAAYKADRARLSDVGNVDAARGVFTYLDRLLSEPLMRAEIRKYISEAKAEGRPWALSGARLWAAVGNCSLKELIQENSEPFADFVAMAHANGHHIAMVSNTACPAILPLILELKGIPQGSRDKIFCQGGIPMYSGGSLSLTTAPSSDDRTAKIVGKQKHLQLASEHFDDGESRQVATVVLIDDSQDNQAVAKREGCQVIVVEGDHYAASCFTSPQLLALAATKVVPEVAGTALSLKAIEAKLKPKVVLGKPSGGIGGFGGPLAGTPQLADFILDAKAVGLLAGLLKDLRLKTTLDTLVSNVNREKTPASVIELVDFMQGNSKIPLKDIVSSGSLSRPEAGKYVKGLAGKSALCALVKTLSDKLAGPDISPSDPSTTSTTLN